jgi:hypothetical protein
MQNEKTEQQYMVLKEAVTTRLFSMGFTVDEEDYDPAYVCIGTKEISINCYYSHVDIIFHHLWDEVKSHHDYQDVFVALTGNFHNSSHPALMLAYAMAPSL